jgi:hypothetical protein
MLASPRHMAIGWCRFRRRGAGVVGLSTAESARGRGPGAHPDPLAPAKNFGPSLATAADRTARTRRPLAERLPSRGPGEPNRVTGGRRPPAARKARCPRLRAIFHRHGSDSAAPADTIVPVGPVAQRLVQGTHRQMVPSRGNARSGRDEFRGTFELPHRASHGNPEPSRRYTGGRCRDYLGAGNVAAMSKSPRRPRRPS